MRKRIKRWWNGQRVPIYYDGQTEGPGGMGKLPDEWRTVYSPSAATVRHLLKRTSTALKASWRWVIGAGIIATIPQGLLALKQLELFPPLFDQEGHKPAKKAEAQDHAGQAKEKKLPDADAPTIEHLKPPVAPSEAQSAASRTGVSGAR